MQSYLEQKLNRGNACLKQWGEGERERKRARECVFWKTETIKREKGKKAADCAIFFVKYCLVLPMKSLSVLEEKLENPFDWFVYSGYMS